MAARCAQLGKFSRCICKHCWTATGLSSSIEFRAVGQYCTPVLRVREIAFLTACLDSDNPRLTYFNWGVRDVAEFNELLTLSHRLQFLYWVAIHRSRAQQIPIIERLSCPLLWCRMSFNEHEKLVDHVSTCRHLDQGEYWCPYHQRAERFAQPIFDRLSGYAPQSSRRPSWKGAVKAIRRLGSKGLQKAIHPSGSRKCQSHGWQDHNSETKEGNQENIQELMSQAQFLELDGQEPAKPALFGATIYEAAGSFLPFEMDDTCNHVAELESETLSCPSMDWESTGNTTPDSSLSPISPVSPGDQWHRQTFESSDSPISPADRNYSVPWASDEICLTKDATTTMVQQSPSVSCWLSVPEKKQQMEYPKSMHIDTYYTDATVFMWPNKLMVDEQDPSLVHGTAAARVAFHDGESEIGEGANGALDSSMSSTTAEDTTVPSPLRHVEDLRDIFNMVFDETMQKLSKPLISQQALTLINLRPSAEFLFANGFETLRKILNNDNKLSFWEVFGLSHLMYASAILSKPVDLKQEFRQIFIEIIRLSSQIICSEDKVAFIQLAHKLWLPEPYPSELITSSDEAMLRTGAEVIQSSAGNISSGTMTPLTLAQLSNDSSTYRNKFSAHSFNGSLSELAEPRGYMTSCRTIRHCLQTLECKLWSLLLHCPAASNVSSF